MINESKFYIFASLVTILVNFLTLPFFTSYLSPGDYGIIALFILFGNVATNLVSFGLNTASYGSYFKYSIEKFKILNFSIILFLIFIFSIFGNVFIFNYAESISSRIFNNEISSELLRLSFLNGCLSYFYTYFGQLLIARKKAYYFSLFSILHICINAITTFYFIKYYSYTFLAGIYGIMFANFFAMLFVIISNYELLTLKISKNKLKKAIIFGIPEVPKLMVGLLYSTFDRTMLASYKGVSEIGYYEFGSRFAGIVKIFNDAIGKSFSPYFQESIHQSNHQSNMNILDSFYKIIFSLGFIGIGISYFSEEALLVLTTEEFHVAKYLVPFLVSYYLFGSLNQLASNQFIASEKLYYMAPISLIGLIINIILNIILIPLLGALGAVISTAVVGFITTIILFFYGNKALKLPISNYKILMIYALIFSFLILGYPILYLEVIFILKVLFKLLLLVLFLIIGFYLRFYNLADIYYLKNIFFNTFKE